MTKIKTIWKQLFGRHLFLTNTLTSGGLLAFGDSIVQFIEIKSGARGTQYEKYDWKRTWRLFLVGLISGPPHHIFYSKLDKVYPKKDKISVMKKVLLDQVIAAPSFALIFFGSAGLLEGKSVKNTMIEFKDKFPTVYLFDWMIWPPSQAVNFIFVAQQYRVLYVNFITVIWDVFLSYMKHYDQFKDVEENEDNLKKREL